MPIALTVIGLPIYCIWAYRRGRRDGVGREPNKPPYSGFGGSVAGWAAAAIFLPFIDWYVFVHLPTLCYKHGLRVGAKDGTAQQGFTSVPAVIGAASVPIVGAIAGLALLGMTVSGGFDSGGDEGYVPPADSDPISQPVPNNTPNGPRLTGAEAAGKAEAALRKSIAESGRKDLSYACDTEDFNDVTQKWVVACLIVGPQNAVNRRFTVDDRFGTVRQIE